MIPSWQALQKGAFSEALTLATTEAAAAPDDIDAHFRLAQFLVIAERPDDALAALERFEPDTLPVEATLRYFRGLIRAEKMRLDWCLRAEGSPGFPCPPPPWIDDLLAAHRLLVAGDAEAAEAKLAAARAQIPASPAEVDGDRAADLQNADALMGPVIEALSPDLYMWIPICQIHSIAFNPAQTYKDLLWRPVDLTLRNTHRPPVRLPTLYSGVGDVDDAHRMGAMTSFRYPAESLRRGVGQCDLLLAQPNGEAQMMGLRNAAAIQTLFAS